MPWAYGCKSQDLTITIDQAGKASKNVKTGLFTDAEVVSSTATITLQKNLLVVSDSIRQQFVLEKSIEQKRNKSFIMRIWRGKDENSQPVKCKMTVNENARTATIELTYEKIKNIYFGTYVDGPLPERKLQPTF